jgi:thioredoxin reductase (NADPH)
VKTSDAEYGEDAIIATGACALPASEQDVMATASRPARRATAIFHGEPIGHRGSDSAWKGGVPDALVEVTVVHRQDALRASKIMQDKAREPKSDGFLLKSTASWTVARAKSPRWWFRRKTATAARLVKGVFVAIGHTPKPALFRGQISST